MLVIESHFHAFYLEVSNLFTCCCVLVLALTGDLLPCSLSCMHLTEVVMLGVEETGTLEFISASTHTETSWT